MSENPFPQVLPLWILLLDQLQFPGSFPLFHLFLPPNGRCHIGMQLIIDELMNTISLRESIHHVISVFPHTLTKVARYPDIQRAVPLAGKNIHRWLLIWPNLTGFPLSRE